MPRGTCTREPFLGRTQADHFRLLIQICEARNLYDSMAGLAGARRRSPCLRAVARGGCRSGAATVVAPQPGVALREALCRPPAQRSARALQQRAPRPALRAKLGRGRLVYLYCSVPLE
jgi:hypothetical protein